MPHARLISATINSHRNLVAVYALSSLGALISLVLFSGYTPNSFAADKTEWAFGPIEYHIPAQPLDVALRAYSKISSVDVLYESRIVAQLLAPPVDGRFTRQAALAMLLAGTDLVVQYTRSDAITISSASYEPDAPPLSPLADADLMLDTLRVAAPGGSPNEGKMREFSESAQEDIVAALRKNARTNSGTYRVGVKLWVDPLRTISRAELAQSSGDAARDASIAEALRGLVLRKEPPEHAPQPIRVRIQVRSS